jgi:hypothetical protein
MRRRLVIVGVLGAILAGASPALAGGSWLEVREVDGVGGGTSWDGWGAPGSIVTMAGDFCHGQGAAPGSATWNAYLRPFDGRGHTARVEVGQVSISDAPGRGCRLLARTTFAVPDVAPGPYWIEVCGDPSCSIGVGDLVGGMVTVASTALEAQLLRAHIEEQDRIAHLARARRHLRTDVHRLEEVVADLERSVRTVGEDLNASDRRAVAAERANDRLGSQVDAANARATRSARTSAVLGGLVVVFAAALTVRRRRARPRVPDTPAELFLEVSNR